MPNAAKNDWTFDRENSTTCVVRDQSGSVYRRSHGDLAAHEAQDFMRWTAPPEYPGGPAGEPFGLKPKTSD